MCCQPPGGSKIRQLHLTTMGGLSGGDCIYQVNERRGCLLRWNLFDVSYMWLIMSLPYQVEPKF